MALRGRAEKSSGHADHGAVSINSGPAFFVYDDDFRRRRLSCAWSVYPISSPSSLLCSDRFACRERSRTPSSKRIGRFSRRARTGPLSRSDGGGELNVRAGESGDLMKGSFYYKRRPGSRGSIIRFPARRPARRRAAADGTGLRRVRTTGISSYEENADGASSGLGVGKAEIT